MNAMRYLAAATAGASPQSKEVQTVRFIYEMSAFALQFAEGRSEKVFYS